MKTDHISAIILAAGLSQRMKQFKPLLKLGGETVIERVISLYQTASLDDICVVVGHRASEMEDLLSPCGVRIEVNPDYESGMYSSVVTGVRHLPAHCRNFFVHPVDIPLIRSQSISSLIKARDETSGKIIYPTFNGRRGHPPLIDIDLKPAILAGDGQGGLRALLRKQEISAVDVTLLDEGILFDLDTPDDYDVARTRTSNADILNDARITLKSR